MQQKLSSQRKLIAGIVKPKAKQPKLDDEGTAATTSSSSCTNKNNNMPEARAGLSLLNGYGSDSGDETCTDK